MIPYANLSGKSGVVEYEIGGDFIKLRFASSTTIYVYDHSIPGSFHVGQMKQLAIDGRGLSTYVSQNVKKDYSRIETGSS